MASPSGNIVMIINKKEALNPFPTQNAGTEQRSEGKVMTTDHSLIFSMSSKTTKVPGVLDDGQY